MSRWLFAMKPAPKVRVGLTAILIASQFLIMYLVGRMTGVSVLTLFYEFVIFSGVAIVTESFFTSIGDRIRELLRGSEIDLQFPCRVFLWAIPVYGLSATIGFTLLEHYYPGFFKLGIVWRSIVYFAGCWLCELGWGITIKLITLKLPWKYSVSSWKITEYINPWYLPFWILFGFVLETMYFTFIPKSPELVKAAFDYAVNSVLHSPMF